MVVWCGLVLADPKANATRMDRDSDDAKRAFSWSKNLNAWMEGVSQSARRVEQASEHEVSRVYVALGVGGG